MEFFQSKQGQLLIIAMAILGALIIGVWKQLDTMGGKPAKNQQETEVAKAQEDDNGANDSSNQEKEEELSQEEKEILANTADVASAKAYELGNKAYIESNMTAAITQYKISLESADIEIKKNSLRKLANCYSRLNDTDNIIDTYEKLVEFETDDDTKKTIYETLGIQYEIKGAYDRAIESYRTSYNIKATPDSALKLCEIYDKIHDEQSIRDIIRDYTAKDPKYAGLFSKYRSYQPEPPKPVKADEDTEESKEGTPPPHDYVPENSNPEEENNQQ